MGTHLRVIIQQRITLRQAFESGFRGIIAVRAGGERGKRDSQKRGNSYSHILSGMESLAGAAFAESPPITTSTVSPVGCMSDILRPRQEGSSKKDMTTVAAIAAAIVFEECVMIS
jgi:hypothetical protein